MKLLNSRHSRGPRESFHVGEGMYSSQGLRGLSPANTVPTASAPPPQDFLGHYSLIPSLCPVDSPSAEEQHKSRRAPGSRRSGSQPIYVGKRMMQQETKLQGGLRDGVLDRLWDGDEAAVPPSLLLFQLHPEL